MFHILFQENAVYVVFFFQNFWNNIQLNSEGGNQWIMLRQFTMCFHFWIANILKKYFTEG